MVADPPRGLFSAYSAAKPPSTGGKRVFMGKVQPSPYLFV